MSASLPSSTIVSKKYVLEPVCAYGLFKDSHFDLFLNKRDQILPRFYRRMLWSVQDLPDEQGKYDGSVAVRGYAVLPKTEKHKELSA